MQDSVADLRAWSTWQAFVDALRAAAPPDGALVEFVGTISGESWGGGFRVDGDARRWPGGAAVEAELQRLGAIVGPAELAVSCRVGVRSADPADRVRIVERSPLVERGAMSPISAFLLEPGARPAPFAAAAHDWQRPVAATADAGVVVRTVAELLAGEPTATADQLAAIEAELGVALPAELHALYQSAGIGDLPAFGIVPLVGDVAAAFRNGFAPAGRFLGWDQHIARLAPRDPTSRVQSLVGTPRWFVFGHDRGGNAFAADLTPGPNGHTGQIVFLDGRAGVGAQLVADSLTDFLAGRLVDPAPPAPDHRVVRLNHRAGLDLTVVDDTTEVLEIGVAPEPIDLATITGHPGLRALTTVGPTSLADPLQATTFANLEYLSLAPAVWHALVGADDVPPALKAIGFGAFADLDATIEAAASVAAALARPGIAVTDLHPPG